MLHSDSNDNISRLNFKNKIKVEIESEILLNAIALKVQARTSQRSKKTCDVAR